MDELVTQIVPDGIRRKDPLHIPAAMSEFEYLQMLHQVASGNKVYKSYIGQGYYGTIVPSPILRSVFENPGWYTQYTPYQAEIAQGRLEALLNFQTVISDLTGLEIANASLLDESTAAAEAMAMFYGIRNKRNKDHSINKVFVDQKVFPQTQDVIASRAKPIDIELTTGNWSDFEGGDDYCAAIVQFPNAGGAIEDYRNWVKQLKEQDIHVVVIADILSLVMLESPGSWGADAVVGNSQRFGVPMGFGGPHAAFFATKEDFKRVIPGRIIGVSQDRGGNPALRMALQTREQHIKREKATSNICTAQALLAVMAGFYAVYHGPEGIRRIATQVHERATALAARLQLAGFTINHKHFFDTVQVAFSNAEQIALKQRAVDAGINLFYGDDFVQMSVDETTSAKDLDTLVDLFTNGGDEDGNAETLSGEFGIPAGFERTSDFMTHEVFSSYNTETELMRYMKRLENKDLSLVHSMIPLGSCTMKLNAATQLMPVSWPEFANIHPYAPEDQTEGYAQVIRELEQYLEDITGFTACSLMPNSGAQGELTGLLVIRAYHEDRGESNRNVALIPSSAHGTNPASAVMAGMQVVVVASTEAGNIDVDDLRQKAVEHRDNLAGLMVTYPSTHGVYESAIHEICDIIHENGGLVYMDGANMNAQVGLTSPGQIDADVCHLNLHKTFAIPHGGGGPGMGPICANDKLAPYLPRHRYQENTSGKGITAVNGAPYGSASILLISYGYIRLLGPKGLLASTEYAMLNANYLESRLKEHFQILYVGEAGRIAHEFILDLRPFKSLGVSAEDVAKRLIDYGFHAPTLSFPVAGTLMIEPTESESKFELDRFCDAMIRIKAEIDEIATGTADATNNVLVNAPHTIATLTSDSWDYPYSREKAAFPMDTRYRDNKFWPPVGRIDNAYGDRNLICTCPPIEEYADA